MYLIINKDGSIQKAVSEEFIQQGSNNVNYIDFAIEDRNVSDWTMDCVFSLPDETTIRLNGTKKEFTYGKRTLLGYRVYLTSAVLTFAGEIKITVRAYNSSGDILYTFPFTQFVNPTMDNNETTPPDITEEQYKSIMALLSTYITKYDTHLIRKYDTMDDALKDISNIPSTEHILISNGLNDYEMYYKPSASSVAFSKVPSPTNWNDIYSYTGLSKEELSKLTLTTIKDYINKYDAKNISQNLLSGILTTTLTLKDLSTLTASVDFKTLFYTKSETYSKDEADKTFLKSVEVLKEYLTKSEASDTYLTKTNADYTYLSKDKASDTYLSKENAEQLYLTDSEIGNKYATISSVDEKNKSQDTLIANIQTKSNEAYNLASSKANTFVFDTYKAMEEALKSASKDTYHLGDTLLLKETKKPDYWISGILDTNTGDYGFYEISEVETKVDLSDYQKITDNALLTKAKTIVGAINENKSDIATKQASSDNSLTTTNKTLVGAINEVNKAISEKGYAKVLTDENLNDVKAEGTYYAAGGNSVLNKPNGVDGFGLCVVRTATGYFAQVLIGANGQTSKVFIRTMTTTSVTGWIEQQQALGSTQMSAVNSGITSEKVKQIQTNTDNISAFNTKLDTKLNKESAELETTSKSIVGAINENKENIEKTNSNITQVEGKIPTKVSQLDNDSAYITNEVSNLTNYTTNEVLQKNLDTKADKSSIPTKLSELDNDTNYITNAVSDLANYYTITDVDTKLGTKADTSSIPTKVSELTNDSGYINSSVSNLKNYTTTTALNTLLEKKADKTSVPSKVSQLANDSEFITKSVDNLVNYTNSTDLATLLKAKLDTSALPTKVSAFTNDAGYITQSADNLLNYTLTSDLNTLLKGKLDITALPSKLSAFANDTGYITTAVDNLANYTTTSALTALLEKKADTSALPTKLSQLTNDKGYVLFTDLASDTKAGLVKAIPIEDTNGLAGVYIKDGILYAKATEVPVLSFKVVETLPGVGESGVIYLLKSKAKAAGNNYTEYVWVNNAFEELGATSFDLTGYATIEYVDNAIKPVNDKFSSYYDKTTTDTKINAKLNESAFTSENIITTIGDSAVNRATGDSLGNAIDTTYATKVELSDKLDKTSFTATTIINTLGTNAVNKAIKDNKGNTIDTTYATKNELADKLNKADLTAETIIDTIGTNAVNKANKDGDGNTITATYATKTELETGLTNKLDTSEYTATKIITKIGDTPINRAISDSEGNVINETYATITSVNGKVNTADYTADKIIAKLGDKPVNRATSDKSGNDIALTYATKDEVGAKLDTSDLTAKKIVDTLGTTSVNRATSDSLGNNINTTYATKTSLNGKLDSNAQAIVDTLGDVAVSKSTKAIQDENGNNIAQTYEKNALILNCSVSSSGEITFAELNVATLLNAVKVNQRIVLVPSNSDYPSIDLNARKTGDNEYRLNGSCSVDEKTYSVVLNANTTSASGTYTLSLNKGVDIEIFGEEKIIGYGEFKNVVSKETGGTGIKIGLNTISGSLLDTVSFLLERNYNADNTSSVIASTQSGESYYTPINGINDWRLINILDGDIVISGRYFSCNKTPCEITYDGNKIIIKVAEGITYGGTECITNLVIELDKEAKTYKATYNSNRDFSAYEGTNIFSISLTKAFCKVKPITLLKINGQLCSIL